MTGRYEIEIYNNRVHYFLTVKRNITILEGDSATGKSELLRLIESYEENGASSGITLKADIRCTVLGNIDWELRLGAMNGNIIFIDETASFLATKRFAELVRGADNYFVIITRDALKALPYSIDEIYGLKNVTDSDKYRPFKRVFNEMYNLYHLEINRTFHPDVVITEDSNSGFDFFKIVYDDRCISSYGKSNVYNVIKKYQGRRILAVVDGAAFGCEIKKIMDYLETMKCDCVVYAPESFEFLILASGIIDVPSSVLEKTYDYADSRMYLSWEEFYYSYLSERTRNTVYQYGKSSLGDYYRDEGNVKKIKALIPLSISS